MGGWMGWCKSGFKDCLQQSTNALVNCLYRCFNLVFFSGITFARHSSLEASRLVFIITSRSLPKVWKTVGYKKSYLFLHWKQIILEEFKSWFKLKILWQKPHTRLWFLIALSNPLNDFYTHPSIHPYSHTTFFAVSNS